MKRLMLVMLFPMLMMGQTQIGEDFYGDSQGDLLAAAVGVSSDGNIVAVSSPYSDIIPDVFGIVRIYERQGENWIQKGQDIEGSNIPESFGEVLSLSGDGNTIALGINSYLQINQRGRVDIYSYQNNDWVQLGESILGPEIEDLFSRSIAISDNGQTVVIGAPNNDDISSNTGEVQVFQFENGGWVQVGNDINGEASSDNFGTSVSMSSSGDIIAVGSPGAGTKGRVKIFENQNNSWVQLGEDIDGVDNNVRLGNDVELSSDGDVVAIGDLFSNSNGPGSGRIKVFRIENNVWSLLGQNIDGEQDDFAGNVALSSNGRILVVGAPQNSNNGFFSGEVRLFQLENDFWEQIGENINGDDEDDVFGTSLNASSTDL